MQIGINYWDWETCRKSWKILLLPTMTNFYCKIIGTSFLNSATVIKGRDANSKLVDISTTNFPSFNPVFLITGFSSMNSSKIYLEQVYAKRFCNYKSKVEGCSLKVLGWNVEQCNSRPAALLAKKMRLAKSRKLIGNQIRFIVKFWIFYTFL